MMAVRGVKLRGVDIHAIIKVPYDLPEQKESMTEIRRRDVRNVGCQHIHRQKDHTTRLEAGRLCFDGTY